MGVCCVVFDIDGMLFDFFMNFLNILFSHFMFSSHFMLFPIFLKQMLRGGGGGGGVKR